MVVVVELRAEGRGSFPLFSFFHRVPKQCEYNALALS